MIDPAEVNLTDMVYHLRDEVRALREELRASGVAPALSDGLNFPWPTRGGASRGMPRIQAIDFPGPGRVKLTIHPDEKATEPGQ